MKDCLCGNCWYIRETEIVYFVLKYVDDDIYTSYFVLFDKICNFDFKGNFFLINQKTSENLIINMFNTLTNFKL